MRYLLGRGDRKLTHFATSKLLGLPPATRLQQKERENLHDYERAYQEAKKKHPGASYARVTGHMIHDDLLKDGSHATLGTNLQRKDEWENQGLRSFERLRRFRELTPDSRVIEYGCGSLRIGYHFINFLNPGNFIGLDVIDGFFEIGKRQIKPEILQLKQPYFAVINSDSIEVAKRFEADFIYLAGVAIHVHDDDAPEFFANLRRIACKENSTLVMSAHIAERSFEHNATSWARPLEFFTSGLKGLRLAAFHKSTTRTSTDGDYEVGYLEFSRDFDMSATEAVKLDLPAVRKRIAARELRPFQHLEITPAPSLQEATADGDLLIAYGLSLGDDKIASLAPPVQWVGHPRSFEYYLHAWQPLRRLLQAFDLSGDRKYFDAAVAIAMDWLQTVKIKPQGRPLQEAVAEVLSTGDDTWWYDMAVAQRLQHLSYIIDVACRLLDVEDWKIAMMIEHALLHHSALRHDKMFRTETNHGFFRP